MYKNILIYGSFIIAGIAVATASAPAGLAVALLFYPPWAFFVFKYASARSKNVQSGSSAISSVQQLNPTVETVDSDKRTFLKLVSAAGFSYFLYSLFSKNTAGMLFGKTGGSASNSLEDIAGNKINPAEKLPTDGYYLSEIVEEANTYTGYTDKTGAWYITKMDGNTGSFRYVKGNDSFPANWSKRESLDYDYFYNVFK